MIAENEKALKELGFSNMDNIQHSCYLNLRYEGTDTSIMVERPLDADYAEQFRLSHQREFGFWLTKRRVLVDNVRVRSVGKSKTINALQIGKAEVGEVPNVMTTTDVYYVTDGNQTKKLSTPVYDLEALKGGMFISGPGIILNQTSTILVEPGCQAEIDIFGNVIIEVKDGHGRQDEYLSFKTPEEVPFDPIELSIFGHRFMSIAEQMGITLQRTAVSTNIKERLDFSCALFDPEGNLVANAPHLPVHLGSMQEAVRYQVKLLGDTLKEGEVILSNHPMAGGTHLPDMTIISPVFEGGKPIFYVASRGHHADIGGIQPGSMPSFSKLLEEEGAAIESFKIVRDGEFQEEGITHIMNNQTGANPLIRGTRNLSDNISDFKAQVAANNRGIMLVKQLIQEYSLPYVQAQMKYIQQNAEQSVRIMLKEMVKRHKSNGGLVDETNKIVVQAEDFMDDGSQLKLKLTIDGNDGLAWFDFTGTDPEMYGNSNAPRAITFSAIIYCLRCLVNAEIPFNQGCLNPISVIVPENTFLNPSAKAAVVGGNVLTSQRITDVVLKAFSACAASQGCMNNLTFGDGQFGYYETIAGGAGAGPTWHGKSGVHTHMTNTRITDPEVLE